MKSGEIIHPPEFTLELRAIDLEKAAVFDLFDTLLCILCVMDHPY